MTPTKRIPKHKSRLKKGPACTICKHPDRVRIEATKAAGASLDSISAKYGVSRDALWRHWTRHVDEDLKASYLADVPVHELAKKAADEGVSVLEYLSLVRSALMNEFQLTAAVHDRHAMAALAGRLTEVLREVGRITGEVMRSPAVQNVTNSVTFVNSPVFVDLQQMLIRRLQGHPEALASVCEGLAELERRSAPRPLSGPVIEHEGAHAAA